uniref:Protein S100 n=1 Tax=Callorhinchus milii TaxID=7868 RepID=A0A4W3H9A0_CALMI|eukprot:gi/632962039/ref/XP_007897090.1/ PREDICTED: protein S100-A1-like [Callorhinchus milii]
MSQLDKLMDKIIDLFQHYAKKEGCIYTLNKAEAKELITKEFLGECKEKNTQQKMEQYMTQLDNNQDGEVSFIEFMSLVSIFTVFTNYDLMGCQVPAPPKGKC